MKWFESEEIYDPKYRHVLGISGGKDSAALAIYIKDHYPSISDKMEYFFTDTGAELKEVYEFIDKLEAYLGKSVKRLSSGKSFEHHLMVHNNFLPSPKQRWCTRAMKIKPFENFVKDDPVISYVGIRADENRKGYISQKPTISAVFPFIDDGLIREDVFKILENSVGIPEYYKWRSRSGCYFCFFQRKDEWLGLKEYHPELFEHAKNIEENVAQRKYSWKDDTLEEVGKGYTWSQEGTLDEIVERAKGKEKYVKKSSQQVKWQDLLADDEEDDEQPCLICT